VRTGIFVQVRLGSTRLPRKATLPLPGGSVIQHVMRSLLAVPAEVRALLTDEESLPVLRPIGEAEGFLVMPGPAEDVLARYCNACRDWDVQRVVRATGDNPLTSASLARSIMEVHVREHADLSHYLGCPWGTGVEVVEAAALLAAERDATAKDEREHITTFLYRHPGRFTIVEPQAPAAANLPEARVTVDTAEDYREVGRIYGELYHGAPVEIEELVRWLRKAGEAAHAG
jgi:spore coat polysaccharide biosynthesis protein SpsF